MNTAQILDRLEKFASLLELNDANPFKIRAYTNGIRTLENTETSLEELIQSNGLTQLKGIGKGLAAHIMALYQDQPDSEYDQLMSSTPSGLLDMLRVQAPKKSKRFMKRWVSAALVSWNTPVMKTVWPA